MRRARGNPVSLFSFQDIITGLCGVMLFIVLVVIVDLVAARTASDGTPPVPAVPDWQEEKSRVEAEIKKLQTTLAELEKASENVIVAVQSTVAPEIVESANESQREAMALYSQVEALRTQLAKMQDADAADRKKREEMEQTVRLLQAKLQKLKHAKGITLILEPGEARIPVYVICDEKGLEVVSPFEKSVPRKFYSHEESASFMDQIVKFDPTTHTVVMLVRPSGVVWMAQYVQACKELYGYSIGRDPLEEDVEVSFAVGGAR